MAGRAFEINEALDQQIDAIQARLHTTSAADVLRRAIALMDYVTKEQQENGRVIVIDSDGNQKEIVLK